MARAYGRIIYKPPVRLYCAAIKAYVLPTCEFVVGISSFFLSWGDRLLIFAADLQARLRETCARVCFYIAVVKERLAALLGFRVYLSILRFFVGLRFDARMEIIDKFFGFFFFLEIMFVYLCNINVY